jgi:hypothetical protein
MTNRTAAAKLAVCRWIRDQVRRWEDEAKAELGDMVAGDRRAALLAGYTIGTVTMCEGKRQFHVVDDRRLGEWVAERWPEQIETIVQVRPAFLNILAARALKHGALIDDDGEVCPWAELRRGEPYLMTKPGRDIDGVMQGLLYRGYTIDSIIRELPEGTTDASHADITSTDKGFAQRANHRRARSGDCRR